MLTSVNSPKFMNPKLKVRIYIFCFISLSGLPLVWLSGSTWNSNADDILPTLISIENWRFLFWGHSRFGTFVPLLAKPFTEIRTNLLFQNFLHAISLAIFVFALGQTLYKNSKVKNRVLFYISTVVLFLLINSIYLTHLISGQPYAASLGIFGTSLLLVNSKVNKKLTVPILVVIIAIACWINPLSGFYLAPLLFVLVSIKNFKSIFYEIALCYLLFTFGIFFIVLGLANGETGGTALPNFRAFGVFNWWLSLFVIQLVLFALGIYRRNLKSYYQFYLSFLMTWLSIFALTSLKHIQNNLDAPRYFITSTFISMCLTMYLVEKEISASKLIKFVTKSLPKNFPQESFLIGLVLILAMSNLLIANNLTKGYPLEEPQKSTLIKAFADKSEPYSFASGDFWYAWPTKLFVAKPEDIFVTAFETEHQYDIATDSKRSIQARLKTGDLGLCFGEIRICEEQVRIAAIRIYSGLSTKVELIDWRVVSTSPILVSEVTLKITSK